MMTISHLAITKARVNLGALAKRAHVNKEYFILEKDGIPVIGIMDAQEMEDYLEVHDPKAHRQIQKSNADIRAGRTRKAEDFLADLDRIKAPRSQRHRKAA